MTASAQARRSAIIKRCSSLRPLFTALEAAANDRKRNQRVLERIEALLRPLYVEAEKAFARPPLKDGVAPEFKPQAARAFLERWVFAPNAPLRIASTVELRPYAWDFVSWMNEDDRPPLPAVEDVLVLFWRNRDLAPRRARATQEELVLLKQAAEHLPVERDATFEDLHGAGIILGRP